MSVTFSNFISYFIIYAFAQLISYNENISFRCLLSLFFIMSSSYLHEAVCWFVWGIVVHSLLLLCNCIASSLSSTLTVLKVGLDVALRELDKYSAISDSIDTKEGNDCWLCYYNAIWYLFTYIFIPCLPFFFPSSQCCRSGSVSF